jgi:HD-GYP domain-containing protein (c-di-GMP phosphodiesterase class II)
LIAQRAGFSDTEAGLIRIASPMHDIGKIGVPDEILRKPGKLTGPEMEQMRKHPVIGNEILAGSDSELLRLGGLIALTHHERWDGSGSPSSLSGVQIPVEGRIVAIADVFDALTSERPYKAAFSADESLSIMREGRGKHFDPDLLDVFMDLADDVIGLDRLAV